MPSQFPPRSSARHMANDTRRSNSRRSTGNTYYQQAPFVEAQGRRSHSGSRLSRNQHNAHNHVGEKKHHSRSRLSTFQGHLVAMSGEFVGTIMFLWFALAGTQAAVSLSTNDPSPIPRIFYIATVFGLSLLVCAWVFYRISGGLFNPAVTLGLATAGKMPWMRALFILPAQILGGIVAAALVSAMFPGSIALTSTTLSPGVSVTRGVFIEAFLTFILVFTILMLAAEQNMARPVAPVGIGLALFIAELAGVPYTGGSLNPARSFGPCVVIPSFPRYHYIYWFGPVMGALVAALYFRFVKFMNYAEAQPGQDHPLGEDDVQRTQSRDV